MYICEKGIGNENEDRCTIDCFFSGIPQSTIFSALKYAPQLLYLVYLAVFGHRFEQAKYGQMGYP